MSNVWFSFVIQVLHENQNKKNVCCVSIVLSTRPGEKIEGVNCQDRRLREKGTKSMSKPTVANWAQRNLNELTHSHSARP